MLFKFIVFLIVFGGISYMAWSTYRRKDKEALLRINPPPLSYFECELPSEFMNSNVHMAQFYASMRDMLQYDPKIGEMGIHTLHIGIYAEKKSDVAEAHFVVACDEEKMNDVKARLSNAFGTDLVLKNIDGNPFAEELEKTKAIFPVERPFQEYRDKQAEKKAQAMLAAQQEQAMQQQLQQQMQQQGVGQVGVDATSDPNQSE